MKSYGQFCSVARALGLCVLCASALGCGSATIAGGGDGGTVDSPAPDVPLPTFPDAAPCTSGVDCGGICCAAGQFCAGATCKDPSACATNDDCQDDTMCDPVTHLCTPYPTGGTDPTCTNIQVIGVFAPAVQCNWLPLAADPHPGHMNVYGTPMVADFDFDRNKPAVHPSIVFVSSDSHGGGADECVGDATHFGVIRIIDGATCGLQYSIDSPAVIPSSPVVLADLDGDGRPDIVAHRVGGGLVAFRWNATTGQFETYWERVWAPAAGVCLYSGPSAHDLDDDGKPEVIMGASVFNGQTGAIKDDTLGLRSFRQGVDPVVADVDGDGQPELVTGDALYSWVPTGGPNGVGHWVAKVTNAPLGAIGFTAVGDFGTFGADPAMDDRSHRDGIPEIAVVSSAGDGFGAVRVVTLQGRVIMPPTNLHEFTGVCPQASQMNRGFGGPLTLADFDGDGRLEIGVAGRGAYTVFDLDCQGTPQSSTCASQSSNFELWAQRTQDCSSSVTGSSVFDFEGDGKAEVLYADECYSRVYDGRTGEVIYSQARNSCTWYENPIVADVDGTLKSKIVIPSNDNCPDITCQPLDPFFAGLRCLIDAECPTGSTCRKETPGAAFGLCRCGGNDANCGGNGYVCRDPTAGPSPMGTVCLAAHPTARVQGVRVIRDALDRWVDSRTVWNQHAYSVTNVNDDGTLPRTSAWLRNWQQPALNNFRQNINAGLNPTAGGDLTGRGTDYVCATGKIHLMASMCNRGTASVGQGVPLTFYVGPPAQNMIACTATSTMTLEPGACEQVACDWTTGPVDGVDIVGVANDDGSGRPPNRECHTMNDRLSIPGVRCILIP